MTSNPEGPNQSEDVDQEQGEAAPPDSGPLMDPSLPPSLDPTSGTTSDESPDQ